MFLLFLFLYYRLTLRFYDTILYFLNHIKTNHKNPNLNCTLSSRQMKKYKIMSLRSDFDIQFESDLLSFSVVFLYYKKLFVY